MGANAQGNHKPNFPSQEEQNHVDASLKFLSMVGHFCLQVHNSAHWVIPEKIHTSPTDGMLEILTGGGGRTLEIQVGGGSRLIFGGH